MVLTSRLELPDTGRKELIANVLVLQDRPEPRQERQDDFTIRGRATQEAAPRDRSPPRRGEYQRGPVRDEGPRQRDQRFDERGGYERNVSSSH